VLVRRLLAYELVDEALKLCLRAQHNENVWFAPAVAFA